MTIVDLGPLKAAVSTLLAQIDAIEQGLVLGCPSPQPVILTARWIRVSEIVQAVAYETGLSAAAIAGPRRTATLFRARAAVCWIARQLTPQSYAAIGIVLGGRDHSSILSAAHRADAMRASDPAFRLLTDRLHHKFKDRKDH